MFIRNFLRFYKSQSENKRVLAHSSDRFNFRYSAFHTVCRVDLVEFAAPTAGIEGTRGLTLQLLNGSDTCCSVKCVSPPRQHISPENVRYNFSFFRKYPHRTLGVLMFIIIPTYAQISSVNLY